MAHKFVSNTSTGNPNLVKAVILPVKNREGTEIPDPAQNRNGRDDLQVADLSEFFLNPASWVDLKSTKWIKHSIPGLSDPHQQWIAGGPRTITFEALITRDTAESITRQKRDKSFVCQLVGRAATVVKISKIATQIQGLSVSEVAEAQNIAANSKNLELDITDKLNFYRSLLYPNVSSQDSRVSRPPNLVKLLVGTTLGKRTRNSLFVVDKVEIRVVKQFSDLTPIEAIVNFTLTEFVTRPLSSDTNILTDTE